MSKFFAATQRATRGESDPDLELIEGLELPSLPLVPLQKVVAGQEDSQVSIEARQDGVFGSDDVLDEAFDTLLSNTGAEAKVARVSPAVYLPDVTLETGEVEVEAESSSSPAITDSEEVEEPLHPAYERIIHRLLAFRSTPRQSVILVSSSVPGEGASTIARNTAIALGRHRTERVLLVDANLRNPSQHTEFHTERANGLADVIVGSTSLTSAVKNDVSPGLSLLTAGDPVESPSHVLTQSVLQGVVMALTSLFDWVVIDGPPITVYPEASSLAAISGGAVLVIKAEHTRREVVEESKKVLGESDADVIGAVLNRRKYHIPGFVYRKL